MIPILDMIGKLSSFNDIKECCKDGKRTKKIIIDLEYLDYVSYL